MATVLPASSEFPTVADLLERLGNVPPERVLLRPSPGLATEADLIAANADKSRLCELVDGVLVEKAMGYLESLLAIFLGGVLNDFVMSRNLGLVSGPDGLMRLFPGLVRIPDVAFAGWDRFPGRCVPREPIPDLTPDLAIEILSQSNTSKEMARKRRDYFAAGVRLVWIIDPSQRTAHVFNAPDQFVSFDMSGTLDGGDILPGFSIALQDLFSILDRHGD
jgi:Uma2 family endonuclease